MKYVCMYLLIDFMRRKEVIRSRVLATFRPPHCFHPVEYPGEENHSTVILIVYIILNYHSASPASSRLLIRSTELWASFT